MVGSWALFRMRSACSPNIGMYLPRPLKVECVVPIWMLSSSSSAVLGVGGVDVKCSTACRKLGRSSQMESVAVKNNQSCQNLPPAEPTSPTCLPVVVPLQRLPDSMLDTLAIFTYRMRVAEIHSPIPVSGRHLDQTPPRFFGFVFSFLPCC
jgi:hypothetical protein